MKNIFSLLILASFLSCESSSSNFHDGEYVFVDSTRRPVLHESIFIYGYSATLRFRSFFNQSKLSKTKYLCFQRTGKIDLYMGKREPPLSILVNKDGNLLFDDMIFVKQTLPVISNTPVSAFFLQRKYEK